MSAIMPLFTGNPLKHFAYFSRGIQTTIWEPLASRHISGFTFADEADGFRTRRN